MRRLCHQDEKRTDNSEKGLWAFERPCISEGKEAEPGEFGKAPERAWSGRGTVGVQRGEMEGPLRNRVKEMKWERDM